MLKDQKVVITSSEPIINNLILEGWEIKSVTAQHVACSPPVTQYTAPEIKMEGKFCFLLEKQKTGL